MRRSVLLVTLSLATACPKQEGSNLEKMAEKKSADDADDEPTAGDGTTPSTNAAEPTEPPSGLLQAGEGEKIELRLALPEGATYVVTTIGLLALPAVQQPIGFARREEITLDACDGEGFTRACQLTHRTTNYEAELPAGQPLETGEKPVLGLTSKHRIAASGAREGTTSIEGEGADDPQARALAEAHLFYCLRLPAEPVGVGAMWADTCKMRIGGQIVTKQATWKLTKLDEDPDGAGRRAEINVQSKYMATDAEGNPRVGVARGILYLWADSGEPHLYREMIALPLGAGGLKTKTSLYRQFAKLDPKDPGEIVRTDGREFAGFRTLNEVRSDGAPAELEPPDETAPEAAPAPAK